MPHANYIHANEAKYLAISFFKKTRIPPYYQIFMDIANSASSGKYSLHYYFRPCDIKEAQQKQKTLENLGYTVCLDYKAKDKVLSIFWLD